MLVIIVLLLFLYHCDRYKQKVRIATIMDEMGKPHEEHSWYEEELGNELRFDEYSCCQPNEIVTLDRRSLVARKEFIEEDTISQHSHISCSTMGRRHHDITKEKNSQSFHYTSDVNPTHPSLQSVPSITVTPANYDTGKQHFVTFYIVNFSKAKLF